MDVSEYLELAASSRSYRRFSGDPVGEDTLRILVEAARLAPTGNNTQLLRFHLVPGSDEEGCAAVFSLLKWAASLKDWDGPEPGERPGGYVVVCLPANAAKNAVRNIDLGIAAQTMALAAAAQGLGCCMLKSFDAGALADALALPADLAPALVLALGPRGEKVVLEDGPDAVHCLAYWREADGSHHVPKLSVDALLV